MYRPNLSPAAMTYPEIAHVLDSSAQGENVYSFALGTTFDTPDGPKLVEGLAVGDMIRDQDGAFRTILWLRETRAQSQNSLHSGGGLDPDGRRTRFPGVRFVRGRPSDAIIQVMFGEAIIDDAPQFSSQQSRSDYVAQFASSRRRDDEEDGPDTALAAE